MEGFAVSAHQMPAIVDLEPEAFRYMPHKDRQGMIHSESLRRLVYYCTHLKYFTPTTAVVDRGQGHRTIQTWAEISSRYDGVPSRNWTQTGVGSTEGSGTRDMGATMVKAIPMCDHDHIDLFCSPSCGGFTCERIEWLVARQP